MDNKPRPTSCTTLRQPTKFVTCFTKTSPTLGSLTGICTISEMQSVDVTSSDAPIRWLNDSKINFSDHSLRKFDHRRSRRRDLIDNKETWWWWFGPPKNRWLLFNHWFLHTKTRLLIDLYKKFICLLYRFLCSIKYISVL